MPFEEFLCPEKFEPSSGLEPVLLSALVVVLGDGLIHCIHISTFSNLAGSPESLHDLAFGSSCFRYERR